MPAIVEWKGGHNLPGDDPLPADLRVDHVYLISCKYDSPLLHNRSPSRVFDHALRKVEGASRANWYGEVAPAEYQALYEAASRRCGFDMPSLVSGITQEHREILKGSLQKRAWPAELVDPYRLLCQKVSATAADRWRASLSTKKSKEQFLWRLLRFGSAPYFVLGNSPEGPMRLRIATPWDWQQSYIFRSLSLDPLGGGQPARTGRLARALLGMQRIGRFVLRI